MITKEHNFNKYCCFYVSDFHLEMILLPYIKDKMDKTKFAIITEENLSESMKILLDRTNLNIDEKNKILNLNWDNKNIEDIAKYNFNEKTIIIKGSINYISRINEKIEKIKPKKINIIDCYNINEKSLKVEEIQEKYDKILNTKNIKK